MEDGRMSEEVAFSAFHWLILAELCYVVFAHATKTIVKFPQLNHYIFQPHVLEFITILNRVLSRLA